MAPSKMIIDLKIAALNLRGRRLNPFAVLTKPWANLGHMVELARTETVWSEPSPAFIQSFELPMPNADDTAASDYRIVVYSRTHRSSDALHLQTVLGFCDLSLRKALAKPDGVLQRVLRDRKGVADPARGNLIVCAERVCIPEIPHSFSIQFGLAPRSRAWGPQDSRKARRIFFVIYRAVSNGFRENEWTPVYRSEIVDSSGIGQQNAVQFEQAAIWAQHLYGSDENRALRLEVFHYASSGAHVSVGFTETSASALKYAKPGGKLYMTPTQGGRLKAAHVLLRMVKVGLCSRGGEMSSVFCLQADAFSWRRKDESEELDMYLDRDVFGRTRVEFMSDREAQYFPRGVSYMSSRCHKLMDEEEEDLGIEQSNFDESDRDYYRDQLSISDEM